MKDNSVAVLGIYACDLVWLAERLPARGETVLGSDFRMGPGGKGSNQAVAARRAGAQVNFIAKLGKDAFGDQARAMYADEGVNTDHLIETGEHPTGAAFIYLDPANGENAIIVTPGAAGAIGVDEIDRAAPAIADSAVFVTQLETPLAVSRRGLEIARQHNVATVFNPAPAAELPADLYPLVDYFTPNETEAAALSGLAVDSIDSAAAAADVFLRRGVKTVVITLGAEGVLLKSASSSQQIAAFNAGAVLDTTGAGDAFNGGFAAALAAKADPLSAARFGCATAGIAVTRPGTAASMPLRTEIDRLLRKTRV